MPETLGFQADLAHTYSTSWDITPEHALLHEGYSEDEFYAAYEKMTDRLRPWTIDFHVAQNDGQVHGAGSHDKTRKTLSADDPNGKLDITKCSSYWLKDFQDRGIKHICWDGCMFSNATPEKSIDMEHDFKSYDRCSFTTILRRTLLEGFPVWEAFFIFIKEA